MGFFSQLGDIWKPSWENYGLKNSFDLIGDAWGNTTDTVKAYASGLWGLATSLGPGGQSVMDAYRQLGVKNREAIGHGGTAIIDTLGAATELPFVKQALGTAGWVQNEAIKRPLGTAALMAGDIARGRAAPLDGDKWQQAYNDTRAVSTGQAFVYAAAAMPGGQPDPFNVVDPRRPQTQALYHTNTALKLTSGSIDAAVDMFADPTIVASKFAVAGKLKYLSPTLRTTADVQKYIDGPKYAKLKEFIKAAPNSEAVRQRAFNSHAGGDKAAAALWSVRHDDQLYDATFNALHGDRQSWQYLTENAPRIADLTGTMYANTSMSKVAGAAGRSAKADQIDNALRETRMQAFVDAIQAEKPSGMFAEAAAPGKAVLVGQSAPWLSLTSKWRVGVHNWATFGPAVFRGTPIYPVLSRGRYALPSAKFTRLMPLNDENSVTAFRQNLERGPLGRDRVEHWVSAYGRASSAESRARFASAAEDEGFRAIALKHDFKPGEVDEVLPAINRWRNGNRQVFSNSHLYMSDVMRRLAEKYTETGRTAEADNVFFLQQEMEDAIKRGDQPSWVHVILDEDGNNVMIPGEFRVDPSKPVLGSQGAEMMTMVDWRVLDTALWWARRGPVGENAYKVINAGVTLMDTANSLWKTSALLRPGYAPRMLSDEVLRRSALYGAARVLMSTSRGVVNTAYNWSARGGLIRDYVLKRRHAGGLDGFESVPADAKLEDTVDALTDLHRQPVGGPYAPDPRAVELSAAPDTALRAALEFTAGSKRFTKADLRRELKIGDKTANKLLADLEAKGFVGTESIKGRVHYRVSQVDRRDLNKMRKPLKYDTYDRALADGVISVDTYLKAIEGHAERGDLPADLAQILQGRTDGTLHPLSDPQGLKREYQRQVTDRALRAVGRGAYSRVEWAQQFVDTVVKRHEAKGAGEHAPATVVDPMTGTTPDIPDANNIRPDHFTLSRGRAVEPSQQALYDYVADNLDDLLKPRNVLHAYITPGGNMELSVARWDGEATQAVKQTGGVRIEIKLPRKPGSKPFGPKKAAQVLVGPEKRGIAFDRVKFDTQVGEIELAGAFEGAEGNRFMHLGSSAGPQGAWVEQLTDTDVAKFMNDARGIKETPATDAKAHQAAWERAVNLQLHHDPVARMFLNGKTEDDVLEWMRRDDAGRRYWGKLGPWQSRQMEQIYAVKAMVDTLVPDPHSVGVRRTAEYTATKGEAEGIAQGGDAYQAAVDLRQAALNGNADYRSFESLFPSRYDMPAIPGAQLDVAIGGVFTDTLKKAVNKSFRILSDLPADTASRFPFFAERYSDHVRDITPRWIEQYGAKGDHVLPVDMMHNIQNVARQRALADVKKYLYDSSAELDLASAARLFVPFASAVGDSVLKWGAIAREKGVLPPVLNIWKVWSAPDRAGMVQDQDGNIKKWDGTQYVWYELPNPETGETKLLKDHVPQQEYVVFQMPTAMAKTISAVTTLGRGTNTTASGAKMVSYFNKETANTFLGLPTAGPLVAYPVNQFALKNPKLAENWFIKKFVLPFGPTSNDLKALIPANARGTYYWITGDEAAYRGIAQSVMQTEYTKYALGMRDKPPTMAEIQETAQDIAGLQWSTQFFGMSTQFKSPYQPYIDYYRLLQQQSADDAKDPTKERWSPAARFYDEMGDEFRMMTASVSRNLAGLPASIEADATAKKYQDLIAQHPDLASLVVGAEGAGAFSSAVYQAQLEQLVQPGSSQTMREVLPLQDSMMDAEKRYVWAKYGKLMDAIDADMIQRGLHSLGQKGAADLKDLQSKFIEEHKYWTNPQGVQDVNPWFTDFATVDRAAMTKRLTGMAQLATDERLSGRDDMRGLFEYLQARMQVRAEMQQQGFATLDSQKAAALKTQWDSYVTGLRENNLSFADLHHRWLSSDDLSAGFLLNGVEV